MRNRSFLLPVLQNGKSVMSNNDISVKRSGSKSTIGNVSNVSNNNTSTDESGSEYQSLLPTSTDDADAAAGKRLLSMQNSNISVMTEYTNSGSYYIPSAPSSACTVNTINTDRGNPNDLEFFEDLITEPVLVLGVDITHMNPQGQFIVCATGLFLFSLLYGYLQELLSVELCSRQLGLFLAMVQFTGYTGLAYILKNFVYEKRKKSIEKQTLMHRINSNQHVSGLDDMSVGSMSKEVTEKSSNVQKVPLHLYFNLSILRAIDLACTNLAMQYLNYPAKTLMKSSRVVFTMLFGVLIQRKVYKTMDYIVVTAMVAGLALFMHADATSSAVFHYMGVLMLTTSLVCDGAISNMSETMMSKFGIGQDEFIFRMYSIALLAITIAAAVRGDLTDGAYWMTQPGTYQQYLDNVPLDQRVWTVSGKALVMILFSSMGFFGSSCSAAITKNFGALTMSITSTARKATTLFLSFFLFNNICTTEHVAGIVLFISALTTKSIRRRNSKDTTSTKKKNRKKKYSIRDGPSPMEQQYHESSTAIGFGENPGSTNKVISAAASRSRNKILPLNDRGGGINKGVSPSPNSREQVVSVV